MASSLWLVGSARQVFFYDGEATQAKEEGSLGFVLCMYCVSHMRAQDLPGYELIHPCFFFFFLFSFLVILSPHAHGSNELFRITVTGLVASELHAPTPVQSRPVQASPVPSHYYAISITSPGEEQQGMEDPPTDYVAPKITKKRKRGLLLTALLLARTQASMVVIVAPGRGRAEPRRAGPRFEGRASWVQIALLTD